MTNIGTIGGVTNLGPVFGDLSGSVAATILGQNANGTYNVQHYWVTSAGDTIKLKVAILTPTFPDNGPGSRRRTLGELPLLHRWRNGEVPGSYRISGLFRDSGFNQGTLVLRYRGQVCYPE
jgi:hypothetical protein